MSRYPFLKLTKSIFGLFLLVLISSACSEKTDTESSAMFRADLHRSGDFLTQGPQQKPETLWRYHADVGASSSPVSSGNLVFSGRFDGRMLALDKKSGEEQWQFVTGGGIFSTPSVAEEQLVFGSDDKNIYALNKFTGNLLWTFETQDRVFASPLIAKGTIFIGSLDHNFYAIDRHSGELKWIVETQGQVDSSAAMHKDQLYFGSDDGSLYAVSINGERIWTLDTGAAIDASPVISAADNLLYVAMMPECYLLWI